MLYNPWKLNYWLNPRPASLPAYGLIGLFGLGIALLAASYFGVKKLKNKPGEGGYGRWWKKLEYFLAVNGIIALILSFVSYQLIPYLAARFWLLMWLLEIIIWIILLLKNRLKIKKRIAGIDPNLQIKDKYLP
ncbi:MAG: hypothetical protein WCO55_00060 [Candidatus Falkowbacteria bacterium]